MKKYFLSIFIVTSLIIFFGCKPIELPKNDMVIELPEIPLGKNEFETAFEAVNKMKSGVNLGNGFDSNSFNEENFLNGEEGWIVEYTKGTPLDFEKAWGQPATTKELIQGIKKAGFNAIRVPVTWAEHINFDSGNIDNAWMNRVQQVVDWIIEEDMYCLLNTHHDGGTEGWVEASYRAFEKYKFVY